MDLLQGTPPKPCLEEGQAGEVYVRKLREKLDEIHLRVRERMEDKSSRMKARIEELGRFFSK